MKTAWQKAEMYILFSFVSGLCWGIDHKPRVRCHLKLVCGRLITGASVWLSKYALKVHFGLLQQS